MKQLIKFEFSKFIKKEACFHRAGGVCPYLRYHALVVDLWK